MGDSGLLFIVSFRLRKDLDLMDGVIVTYFISTNMDLTQLGEKGRDTYLEHFGTPYSFGFKAYYVLKQALDHCLPNYSRERVAQHIRDVDGFIGGFKNYSIKAGDSLRPVMISEIQDGSLKLLVKVH